MLNSQDLSPSEEDGDICNAMPLAEWQGTELKLFGTVKTRAEVMAYAARMGYDAATGKGRASMRHGGAFEATVDGALLHLYWEAV